MNTMYIVYVRWPYVANVHIINVCNFKATFVLCVDVQIKMGKKKLYEYLVFVKWSSVVNLFFFCLDLIIIYVEKLKHVW